VFTLPPQIARLALQNAKLIAAPRETKRTAHAQSQLDSARESHRSARGAACPDSGFADKSGGGTSPAPRPCSPARVSPALIRLGESPVDATAAQMDSTRAQIDSAAAQIRPPIASILIRVSRGTCSARSPARLAAVFPTLEVCVAAALRPVLHVSSGR